MAEKNKRGFHTVEEPDMEEYERKLREHRVKVVRRTVILIVTVLAVSAGLWVFMALRHYENFDVGSSVDRADTEATKFADFGENILKYSNDGAFYTDTANELIWNQTYEMTDPHDKGGNLRRNRNDNADPAGACGIAGNGGGSDEKRCFRLSCNV